MTYPGGKNAAYQQIINRIPPHQIYIEPFAGSAAIYWRLRRARKSILIEKNPAQARKLAVRIAKNNGTSAPPQTAMGAYTATNGDGAVTDTLNQDAVHFLQSQEWRIPTQTFIYLDPPYLFSSRQSKRNLYECEFGTEDEHRKLLTILRALTHRGIKIMLSGYNSELYQNTLADWYTHTYTATTRGGTTATEWLWMNYPPPTRLHDYRYLGDDYRERERIKRKASRWVNGLARLPELERRAILSEIEQRYI